MYDWTTNAMAEAALGLPTHELVDKERRVMLNITPMPDGTQVVSLTVVIATDPDSARAFAERLLEQHRRVAVRL